VEASWPIDMLITMYLTDLSPESWTLTAEVVHLEVRGARGSFRFSRLTAADYAFRASLSAGRWTSILLFLLTRGGGALSLDHLIARRLGATHQ
jgi:hypothetical protein